MIVACMSELFRKPWGGHVDQLSADMTAERVHIAVAIESGEPCGFIAWSDDYDIHHCVRGASVCELYVDPRRRGAGIAAQLVAFACRQVSDGGGAFLKGTAVPSAVKLYDRVAWGWDCREMIVGGRAFRALAKLAGARPREIARGLPDPASNHGT
jgi:GNAT superfamily N-acetyltransferase